jgi:L-ascorbate metabolism protein UlaG (beta-lactamase superfamily)
MKANWTRRAWVAGVSAAGLGGAAAILYQAAPRFWRLYFREMRRPILPPPHKPALRSWPDRGLHVAWLGHATLLLRIDGFTILTDPVFSERAGIHLGPVTLGVKRLVAPPVSLRELPRLDLILLSHAHMDHFDIPTLRRLEGRAPVVTARATSDLLRADRYPQVAELGWDQELQVGPARIRAVQVNHWGARMRSDTYRGYNGYVIEAGRYRVLFAGDTADTDLFRKVRGRRAIDLAAMPIGAYNPWIRYHCTPEQAWRMGNEAGAEFFVPMHHRTFALSDEPVDEPIERFRAAAANRQDRIALEQIGLEFHI